MTSIPPPGAHGDDAARVAAALGLAVPEILDLAASMNPVAPPFHRLATRHLGALERYPDPSAATAALAGAMGVDEGYLLLTNGGAEAIALVAAERPTGWVEEPDFALYRRHLETLDPHGWRWMSNPHNPTGRLARPDQLSAVVDEAFYALSTGTWTRGDHERGSVVVGSLTKLFACPGLRLGYVLSTDDSLMQALRRRQPQWSVNALGCSMLPDMLEHADLPRWADEVRSLRRQLVAVLESHGLAPDPSDANFVLVPAAPGLRDCLARSGVLVRDCSSFGLLDTVRIAVPNESGLDRLAGALSARWRSARQDGRPGGDRPRAVDAIPSTGAGRLTGAILVAGTSSDAGKSHVVTGLCRLLARRGVAVAPFKAQNMSLNSFATPDGAEIGRAQGVQALAARVTPEAAMNPVLLKPTGERRSQVVVMGRPAGDVDASAYLSQRRETLLPIVLDAFASLRSRFEVVVCEGAGGAAEINLLQGDLANLRLAVEVGMPAIVVGDIERGGVFAALYGTVAILPAELAATVKGFVINKFRGDPSILRPGLDELEARTGVPVLGVLPFVPGLHLDAEDSLGFDRALAARPETSAQAPTACHGVIDVAVVRLPHIANFTDLDALALEPGVRLRSVVDAVGLGEPDVVVLPGSKATVADLEWLRASGLASALLKLAQQADGPSLLGICAGYQMMGTRIVDHVESGRGEVAGLGLLPIDTEFGPAKVTRPRRGRSCSAEVTGYEIRHGQQSVVGNGDGSEPFIQLDDEYGAEAEGRVAAGGRIAGTSLHGLFESDGWRMSWLAAAAARRGRTFVGGGVSFAAARERQIDRLADLLEEHLDLDAVLALIGSAR